MTNPPEGIPEEAFKKLKEDYQKSIPEKLQTMKTSLSKLKENYNKEDLTALRFIVHKTAGNAGTFGYQKVTDLCKQWDAKLTPMVNDFKPEKPSDAFFQELEQFVAQVEKEFQSG